MATLASLGAPSDPGTLLTTSESPPSPAAPGPTNIVAVSARTRTLLLTVDGRVISLWSFSGLNGISNVAAIAAGYTHDVALMLDGTVRQWPPTNEPPVPTNLTNVLALAAGNRFTCALQADGRVIVWGRSTPVTNVPPGLTNIASIAAGRDHVLALTDTGNVIAWGNFGTHTNVPADVTNVAFISAVGNSSVAATADGIVWRWGETYAGPARTNVGRHIRQVAVTRTNTYALDLQGNLLQIRPPSIRWNVTNLAGIFTSDFDLHAIARGPVLRSQLFPRQYPPEVRSGGYGENWALAVAAESYHPFTYQWFMNGAPVNGANSRILRFTGLRTNHTGTYFAMVTNLYGTMTSAPVTLNVTAGCDKSFSQTAAPADETNVASISDAPPVVPPGVAYSIIPSGVGSEVTSMAFAPDGRIFICERRGFIRVAAPGFRPPFAALVQHLSGGGEYGLVGIAVDPGFQTNSFLYVNYTLPQPDFHNRISRLTANGNVVTPCSEKVLLEIEVEFPYNFANHFGGALHFGPDGKLYAGVGDHFVLWREAQSLQNLIGKILCINPDGSIPEDNPFYDVVSGSCRAIWARGLRNPFTFAIHHRTGRMLINDVGSNWEEINDGLPGANYGWPHEEGDFETNVYSNPIHSYLTGTNIPGGLCAGAVVGAALYDPPRRLLPAEYVDSYFFGDYCKGWIRRLDTNGVVHNFATNLVGLVDIDVGPDGALYCLTVNGALYRFTGAATRFLSAEQLIDGRVHLRGTGITNQPYVLEHSIDLENWHPLSTNQPATNPFDLYDPAPPNTRQRFYRLRD